MTALSANAFRPKRNVSAVTRKYPVEAAAVIYAGALVSLDSTGYAQPAAAGASNQGCVGVAKIKADNTSGSSGDIDVEVEEGEFLFAASSIAVTSLNLILYGVDDNTVDETDTGNLPKAGLLREVVSSTLGWVEVSGAIAATHG